MSQAEIAGGRLTDRNELPQRGCRLRDLDLTSSTGEHLHLSDYRGRRSLVLLFSDDHLRTRELLSETARRVEEFSYWEAEILVIAPTWTRAGDLRTELPHFSRVLVDDDGSLHREFGAIDSQGAPAAALYITDRFGELLTSYRTAAGDRLPTVTEILGWLQFIGIQCPECEPPEWPV